MEKKNVATSVLFLLILLLHSVHSQDKVDPPPLPSTLFPDSIYDANFHTRHFIRGWNYSGGTKKLDSALRMNYQLSGFTLDALIDQGMNDALNPNGHRKAYQLYYVFHNRGNPLVKFFNGHSLYLKPYITIDRNNYFEAKPDEGTGAVFGFVNKFLGDTITETIGSDVFHTFRLKKDSIIPGNPRLVLSHLWPHNALRYLNYSREIADPEDIDTNSVIKPTKINGIKWYLTINLRSIDTIIPSNLLDSVVLTLRIRYKTYKTNIKDSIIFWKVPSDPMDTIIGRDSNDIRGLARNPIESIPDEADSSIIQQWKEWRIKARHLVTGNNGRAGKFITLSALFANYGEPDSLHPYRLNPKFKPEGNFYPVSDYIDSIDLVVIYHGHLDLSINYIRFETPQAQEIFRGKYDDYLRMKIEELNDTVPKYNRCDMRIHRLYLQDEPIPSEWATTRYVNKLLNGLGVVETGVPGYEPGSLNPFGRYYYQNFLRATGFDMLWPAYTIAY
jgi:hypothetical protein